MRELGKIGVYGNESECYEGVVGMNERGCVSVCVCVCV